MENEIAYKMSIYPKLNGKKTIIIYRVYEKEKNKLDKIIHEFDYNDFMVEHIKKDGWRFIIKHYEHQLRKEKITKLLNG